MANLRYVRRCERDPRQTEPAVAGSVVSEAKRPKAVLAVTVFLTAVLFTAGAAPRAQEDTRFDLELRATVTVVVDSGESLADVNGDGNVDRLDLGLVARHMGTSPPSDPRADADRNLVVDVRDLALVGQHVGR